MTDRIDIVIANNGNGGVERFRESLERLGMKVDGVHLCGTKEELERCLGLRGGSIGAAVIFEQFGGSLVTVDDFARYLRTLDADAVIVPVIQPDRKGGEYVRGLYNSGILNAVYAGEDGTTDMKDIISVIARPRQPKDAQEAYGLLQGPIPGEPGDDGITAGCAGYVRKYDGTQRDLVARLSEAKAHVGAAGLVDVLRMLPAEMLEQLLGIPEYDITVNAILSGGAQASRSVGEEPVTVGIEEYEAGTGKRPRRRPWPVRPGGRGRKRDGHGAGGSPERAEARDVAFVATNVGVGCTFDAVMCAHSLSAGGARVALVELDDADGSFRTLCGLVRASADVDGCTSFSYGGVDYYLNTHLADFRDRYRPGYEYVVYDIGACTGRVLAEVAAPCGRTFVAAGQAEYKLGELNRFMKAAGPADEGGSFVYLFMADGERRIDWVRSVYPDMHAAAVPYCGNPWNPSWRTRRFFRDVVSGNHSAVQRKGREIDMGRRLSDRPWRPASALAPVAAGMLAATAVVLGVLLGRQGEMMRASEARARTEAASMEAEAGRLRGEIGRLDGEIAGMERTVVVLREDAPAGTRLTVGMLTEEVIHSDTAQEEYALAGDAEGMYLSCNLRAGMPVMRQHLARGITDALPWEVEHGTEGKEEAADETED